MFDATEFIRLAGKLCVLGNADEAAFRTAASRAYYGAFHIAERFLDDLGFPVPRNENAHGFLRLQLMGSGHTMATSAGAILGELYRARVKADYDLTDVRFRNAEFARLIVERAHELKSLLDQCRLEPERSGIHQGIIRYQEKLND